MAVTTERRPYGPPSSVASFKQIFHQTREPLQVIQSCLSFTEGSWDFISENVPCPRIAPLIIRAATYWLLWNEKAEEIATWRYRIEDFPDLLLEEFFYRLKGFYDRRLIDSIPRDFNTRKQGWRFHFTGIPQSRHVSPKVGSIDGWKLAKLLRGDMGGARNPRPKALCKPEIQSSLLWLRS
jgi:hypothetical protein